MQSISEKVDEILSLYDTFPYQIKKGYEVGLSITPAEGAKRIALCGMGGSGVTGDYIKALAIGSGVNTPIEIIKGEKLPNWVDDNYLVIGISYSGNTHETLSCVREAYRRGSRVAAVTSGGKLEKIAMEKNSPLALIDKNYYPRTAIGLLVSATLGVIKRHGINIVSEDDINDAVNILKSTSRGEGLGIASDIADENLYIISGCGEYDILANRWRQEFSENTKAIAKTEAYPESAHNDLVSWQIRQSNKIAFILLSSKESKLCSILTDFLAKTYRAQDKKVVIVSPRGNALFSRLMQGSLLAGYVSVYLAKIKGIDPTDTSITGQYKKELEKENLT